MSKRRKFSREFKQAVVEQTLQPDVDCAQAQRAPRRLSRAYVLFDGHERLLNTREPGENVCVLASG